MFENVPFGELQIWVGRIWIKFNRYLSWTAQINDIPQGVKTVLKYVQKHLLWWIHSEEKEKISEELGEDKQ